MNRDVEIIRRSVDSITSMLVGRQIKVTQRGGNAYVRWNDTTLEVEVLNIPNLPDDASPQLISAIQGFLDHEVAHILFSDAKVFKRVNAHPKPKALHPIANMVEDIFIEREMIARFRGSESNMDHVRRWVVYDTWGPIWKALQSNPSATPQEYVRGLLVVFLRALAGQKQCIEFMDEDDKWSALAALRKQIDFFPSEMAAVKNSDQALDLAIKIYDTLTPPETLTPEKPSEGDEGGESDGGGGGSSSNDDEKSDEKSESEEGGSDSSDDDESDADGSGSSDEGEDFEGDESEEGESDEGEGASGSDESESGEDEGSPDGSDGDGEDGDEEPGDEGSGDAEGESDESDSEGDSDEGESDASGDTGDADEGDDEGSDTDSSDVEGEVVIHLSNEDMEQIKEDLQNELSEKIIAIFRRETSGDPWLVYSRDSEWISVKPYELTGAHKDEHFNSLNNSVSSMVGPMGKQLERLLLSKKRSHYEPGRRSGRLNPTALHRISAGDDRVFRKKIVSRSKNTAVECLVDISGSMAWGGGKIVTAMQCAWAVAQMLERCGVPNEWIGFTTGYPTPEMEDEFDAAQARLGRRFSLYERVVMPIFKGWNERLDYTIGTRFADMAYCNRSIMASNCDPVSVQVAAERLVQRTEERKVLMVWSDGEPAFGGDCGAGEDRLREVVREIEHAGVEVIGFGIHSKAVEEYYPKSIVINDVNHLPEVIVGELRRMLLKD